MEQSRAQRAEKRTEGKGTRGEEVPGTRGGVEYLLSYGEPGWSYQFSVKLCMTVVMIHDRNNSNIAVIDQR